MKQKIFDALKQEYKALGLSDASLMGHAEMLAGLGLVTDDNLAAIVGKQGSYLKSLQSENDKRVSAALETARKKFQDENDELKRVKEKEDQERLERERIAKLDGVEKLLEQFKLDQKKAHEAERLEWEKRFEDVLAKNKSTEESFAKTRQELEEKAKAERLANRNSMILAKAKELGISESRINEGFAIAEDMDDAGIATYLQTVANNQKTFTLPGARYNSLPDGAPDKEAMKNVVANMIG